MIKDEVDEEIKRRNGETLKKAYIELSSMVVPPELLEQKNKILLSIDILILDNYST